jgi:hypothetical protein
MLYSLRNGRISNITAAARTTRFEAAAGR